MMTEKELQVGFNQPYSRENWKKIISSVFPDRVDWFDMPMPIDNNDSDKVASFVQLGKMKLKDGNDNDKELALLEVTLKPNVKITRNRVELNNLVTDLIGHGTLDGVLSVFEQGGEDYRFTFSAKSIGEYKDGDFTTIRTDAKRYTYVLGKNESCKTPAQRFEKLVKAKGKIRFEDVFEAFAVDKLSKEFFKEYREKHYKGMVDHLMQTPGYKTTIFGDDEKAIRDFVKLTLGRLVFIQFLQKKRWMGVPANDTGWTTGDPFFLKHAFENFEHKDLFYSNFLEPLFFETLNKDGRPNQIFEVSGTKVPFLNGGLFERGRHDTTLINFPAQLFEALFDFFGRYNFTIDENDPNEQEVGVDPEMLGHIFENLLEDNKDKGTFYTPKEIVHYMCQESLLEYLKTFLEKNKKLPTEEADRDPVETGLGLFIKSKQGAQISGLERDLSLALRDVKICDPAIGSGAFPMGLLNEIFQAVKILHKASPDVVEEVWGMQAWEASTVKKHIIQNAIYGVDIEKGAVDIARLRFWLSLIIDEPEPQPLPNLDYKIVVGNSLVSKFEGAVVEIDWNKKYSVDVEDGYIKEVQKGLREILEKQKEFFSIESHAKKEDIKSEIRDIKLRILWNQLSFNKSVYEERTPPRGGFAPTPKDIKHNTDLKLKIAEFDDLLAQVKKLQADPSLPFDFFEWKLDFPEVLNELMNPNPGFDIVIGNPPYGANIYDLSYYFKKKYPKTTKYYKEIYKLFYNQGVVYLLKKGGILSYITPNTFILQPRYKDLRRFLLNYEIKSILNLGENVFTEVTVPTAIIAVKKEINLFGIINFCDISKNSKYKGSLNGLNFFQINQEVFKDTEGNIFMDVNSKFKFDEFYLEDVLDFKDAGINYQRVNVGLKEKGNSDLSERLFYKGIKERDNHVEYWKGGDINEFFISPYTNRFVRPKIRLRENERVVINKDYFEMKPKLLWRQTASVPISVVDRKGIWFGRSIQAATIKACYKSTFLYEYLCCLLNSNYIRSLYNRKVQEGGRVFPQVKLEKLKKLPVKFTTLENQLFFVELYNRIEKIIIDNSESSTLEEKKILNVMVYRLYELTYDEVKVIDPSFSLSEEEYNNIKFES